MASPGETDIGPRYYEILTTFAVSHSRLLQIGEGSITETRTTGLRYHCDSYDVHAFNIRIYKHLSSRVAVGQRSTPETVSSHSILKARSGETTSSDTSTQTSLCLHTPHSELPLGDVQLWNPHSTSKGIKKRDRGNDRDAIKISQPPPTHVHSELALGNAQLQNIIQLQRLGNQDQETSI